MRACLVLCTVDLLALLADVCVGLQGEGTNAPALALLPAVATQGGPEFLDSDGRVPGACCCPVANGAPANLPEYGFAPLPWKPRCIGTLAQRPVSSVIQTVCQHSVQAQRPPKKPGYENRSVQLAGNKEKPRPSGLCWDRQNAAIAAIKVNTRSARGLRRQIDPYVPDGSAPLNALPEPR